MGVQTGAGETLEEGLALSGKVIVWDQGGNGDLTGKGYKGTYSSVGNVS